MSATFTSGLRAGYFAPASSARNSGFAERAAVDQQEIVDDDAFFLQRARVGRRRAGRDAADIGVMAAVADEEQDRPARRRRTPA